MHCVIAFFKQTIFFYLISDPFLQKIFLPMTFNIQFLSFSTSIEPNFKATYLVRGLCLGLNFFFILSLELPNLYLVMPLALPFS